MRNAFQLPGAALMHALCLTPGLVVAPEMVNAQAVADSHVEEIVVSARRREESLQNVPASVYAIGDAEMFLSGNNSMGRLRDTVSNLNFATDLGTRSRVTVRGLGSDRAGVQANGVGFFVDGVYQNGTARFNAPFLDVERVEVLKGPQGARYGRNAFAGVVNIVTKKPDDELRASVQSSIENRNGFEAAGSVAGPIVKDKLYGKLAYSHNESDGDYEHTITGRDVQPIKGEYADVRLAWNVTDGLELDLKGSVGENHGLAYGFSRVKSLQNLSENFVLADNQRAVLEYNETSLAATWKAAAVEVINRLAYYEADSHFALDGDISAYEGIYAVQNANNTQWSDEVRIQSAPGGPLHWMVGGELVQGENSTRFINHFLGEIDYALLGQSAPALAALYQSLSPIISNSGTQTDVWSVFAEGAYEFADRLELAVSARYDDIRVEAHSATRRRVFEDNALQPLLSLRYRLNENASVYASGARGIRQGGFNGGALSKDYGVFQSDDVTSYEIGLKQALPAVGGHINVAVFYADADTLNQFSGIITDAGTIANGVLTIGGARSRGVEIDLATVLTDNLKWTLAAGWLDCELVGIPPFGSLSPDFQYLPGGTRNGNQCQDASEWNFSSSMHGSWALGIRDWTAIGSLTLSGRGDTRVTTDAGTPVTLPKQDRTFRRHEEIQKPVYLLDASVGIHNDRFTVLLYGENLTNELYALDSYSSELLYDVGLGGAQDFMVTLAPKRRFGLRVRYDF